MNRQSEVNHIQALEQWVESKRSELLELAMELLRLPSENRPPTGSELPVQQVLKRELQALDFITELYSLTTVEGLIEHPSYWPGRDYTNRPNLFASKRGNGGGKSLLFSVHSDVVIGIHGEHDPF